jgi:hypothetical protein
MHGPMHAGPATPTVIVVVSQVLVGSNVRPPVIAGQRRGICAVTLCATLGHGPVIKVGARRMHGPMHASPATPTQIVVANQVRGGSNAQERAIAK